MDETDEKIEKKNNAGLAILGIVVFVLACGLIALFLWNMQMQDMMKEVSQEIWMIKSGVPATPNITSLEEGVYWDCIAWYGSCGKFVYDNTTGMYAPDGYLNQEECAGACADYSLHKKRKLPKINVENYCGNKLCDIKQGEDMDNCPEDCDA